MGQHFVSYARADGYPFVLRLIDEVQRPGLTLWVDKLSLRLGARWTRELDAAISDSDTVLFVWSRASAQSANCERELLAAEAYDKPIVPLKIEPAAERWFPIRDRQELDFTTDPDAAFDELRGWLAWLDTAEGRVWLATQGLERAHEDQRRADDADRARFDFAVAHHERRVADLRQLADEDQFDLEFRADQRIQQAIERERLPEPPRGSSQGVQYVNDLPPSGPYQFRDRVDETERLGSYLVDDAICLVAVSGRDGIGKTSVARRLLEAQGTGLGTRIAEGVVYLTAEGPRPVSAAVLLADLARLVPPPLQATIRAELKRPHLAATQKLDKLLTALGGSRVLVAVDNLEELLDPSTRELREADLDAVLRRLLARRDHCVKVVLLSRTAPEPLLGLLPARIARLPLDDGLPLPDAVQFFRELDAEQLLGLHTAEEALLERAVRLTGGHPSALEALYGILVTSRRSTLPELLDGLSRLPADKVVDYLLGELYNRLDQVDKRIVQALAVYGRAVPTVAVDFLLQSFHTGLRSETALLELRKLRLVRQVDDRWRLPSPNRERVLERIPQGSMTDHDEASSWTLFVLLRRAADYFRSSRKQQVSSIDDLSAQFAEIDLRIQAEQFDEAFEVINEVDRDYLSRWGHSQLLIDQRKQLVGRIDQEYEVGNEIALGHGARLREQFDQAEYHYTKALAIAQALGDTTVQKRVHLNLGSVAFDAGHVDRAEASYRTALALAREHGRRQEEATPLSGLALCLAEKGDFAGALEKHDDALAIARENRDLRLEADLLLTSGVWLGQLGERQRALDTLDRGLQLSRQSHFRLLEGQFLDAIAELVVDRSRPAAAVERAEQAVQIGHELDVPHLLREASYTLALARLCKDDLEEAAAAIDVAWRYQSGRRALASLLLRGIIAFRQRQYQKAYDSFELVREDAGPLRARNERNFALLNTLGLALCGLALCGEEHWLDEAVATFTAARKITDAAGVVERTLRLLDELEAGVPGRLAPARAAVSGSSAPDQITGRGAAAPPPVIGPSSASASSPSCESSH